MINYDLYKETTKKKGKITAISSCWYCSILACKCIKSACIMYIDIIYCYLKRTHGRVCSVTKRMASSCLLIQDVLHEFTLFLQRLSKNKQKHQPTKERAPR